MATDDEVRNDDLRELEVVKGSALGNVVGREAHRAAARRGGDALDQRGSNATLVLMALAVLQSAGARQEEGEAKEALYMALGTTVCQSEERGLRCGDRPL
jgi:hypothetical protein